MSPMAPVGAGRQAEIYAAALQSRRSSGEAGGGERDLQVQGTAAPGVSARAAGESTAGSRAARTLPAKLRAQQLQAGAHPA